MKNKKPQQKKVKNTMLTNVMDFPSDRKSMKEALKKVLVLEPAVSGSVPNSNPQIVFNRLPIAIENPDGTVGDLVLGLDRCFSFGAGKNENAETKALNGYSMSISMYDRDGATDMQIRTVMFIEILAELLIDHIMTDEFKESINNWDIEPALLKKLNPLYYKKDKGKLVPDAPPTMYPKLMWWKAGKDKQGREKAARMATIFMKEDEIDENGEPVQVDPLDYLGVKCHITPAVKFEGVFLGAKNTLQHKIYEAYVAEAESGPKRLLKVATRAPTVVVNGVNPLAKKPAKEELKDENEEEPVDELPEEAVPAPTPASVSVEQELKLSDHEEDEEDVKPKKKVVKKKVTAAKKDKE